MFEILKHFESKYGTLKKKGLRIEGLRMIDPKRKKHVIMVSKPFMFDNRQLPKTYEGLDIKSKIEGDLPKEFAIKKDAVKKNTCGRQTVLKNMLTVAVMKFVANSTTQAWVVKKCLMHLPSATLKNIRKRVFN